MVDGGFGRSRGRATGHAREREVSGKEEGLTADSQSSSMGSGKLLRRRIDGGDLRAPEMKTTTLRSTGASSGRVRRVCSSTGSGRSSGMHSGSEGVAVAVGELVGGEESGLVTAR